MTDMMSLKGPLTRLYWRRLPGFGAGQASSRAMKPRSGSASLAETSWFAWSATVKAPPRLGRVVADRRHQHVIQAGDNFTDRNQLDAFTLHGLFSHAGQTP